MISVPVRIIKSKKAEESNAVVVILLHSMKIMDRSSGHQVYHGSVSIMLSCQENILGSCRTLRARARLRHFLMTLIPNLSCRGSVRVPVSLFVCNCVGIFSHSYMR